MLLRDRLLARMAEMGGAPDYVRLATEVLNIRNAPATLARRLVDQALVLEDRREEWLRMGERICAGAPQVPGVYVLRDVEGRALYVGKANNIRRRLRTHFAGRRWRHLKAPFARAASVEWHEVGSEIEALLREAEWIRDLAPVANVQVRAPSLDSRAVPPALVRDTIVVLPSSAEQAVELLAARVDGRVWLQRAARSGAGLPVQATGLRRFFADATERQGEEPSRALNGFAPLVFSWLAGRGADASRIDPHDAGAARELCRRLKVLLEDQQLFSERIVVLKSGFRSTLTRP
jgi:predicted GIY-YIG superfamily endonuclease